MGKTLLKLNDLIDKGIVWIEGDRWCNRCPSCGKIRKFKSKTGARDATSSCYACANTFSIRKGIYGDRIQQLIDEGKIWHDTKMGNWQCRCSACGTIKNCVNQGNASKSWNKYCHKCTSRLIVAPKNIGRKHSEETKRKKSLALKGAKSPCFGKHLSDETKRKMSQTTRGIPKSPEHFDKIQKSAFKRKDFIFPDGRIEKIQGHENWTLEHLLFVEHVSPDDIRIKTKEKPVVKYNYGGFEHNYFPDCFIKSTNTIVETKSVFTWEYKINVNRAKMAASLEKGYNIRVMVWDKEHNLVKDLNIL